MLYGIKSWGGHRIKVILKAIKANFSITNTRLCKAFHFDNNKYAFELRYLNYFNSPDKDTKCSQYYIKANTLLLTVSSTFYLKENSYLKLHARLMVHDLYRIIHKVLPTLRKGILGVK